MTLSKKLSPAKQLEKILTEVPQDAIYAFIKQTASRNKDFSDVFIDGFDTLFHLGKAEVFKNQINSFLDAGMKRRMGFQSQAKARGFGKAINEAIESAEESIEAGNYREAIELCILVLKTEDRLLRFMLDNGCYSQPIYTVLDLMQQMLLLELTEEDRVFFFEFCMRSCEKETYKDFDWHMTLFGLAVDLFEGKKEEARVSKAFNQEHEDKESMVFLKYVFILKSQGQELAHAYRHAHLDNPILRTAAINEAIQLEEFEVAKALANEAIENDMTNVNRRLNGWKEHLMIIAAQEGDGEAYVNIGRALYLSPKPSEFNYYELLKSAIPENQWPMFIQQLIVDFKKELGYASFQKLLHIYTQEGCLDQLIELLKETDAGLESIDQVADLLVENYPEELARLYGHAIQKFLLYNPNRKVYKRACKYIHKIIGFGQKEIAEVLIAAILTAHPSKTALHEELGKINLM